MIAHSFELHSAKPGNHVEHTCGQENQENCAADNASKIVLQVAEKLTEFTS